MFQLDNSFLTEIGVGDLPEDQKQALLQSIYEELELRVGEELARGMTETQMQEFEKILDGNDDHIRLWLEGNVSDTDEYKELLALDTETRKKRLSDYAASKWLEMNRPNYREVVAQVLEEIKQEILDNKDVILEK